jgi:exodeoxyribonuclease VII large subunit
LPVIDALDARPGRAVRGVAALVRDVSEALAARFGVCAVRGEISGLSRAASGHCYFVLKDADGEAALIRCAMFRRAASLLDFTLADGQLVELRGRVAVYEARGELQFIVEALQRAGAGALYEQFLRTRARLDAQGLFDPSRKRRLPAFARAVGIVTSLGAAALHDVVTALARRSPHVRVVVYPSLVQGEAAPAALAAAIDLASKRAEVDVLIVCRGGGSLEDLWAFNDERVVRAVAACSVPVVCGVGHETDVTLCDLAADLRAPTPTAAAELAVLRTQDCLDELSAHAAALRRRVHDGLEAQAQRLDRSALRLARPDVRLREHAQRLGLLAHRLASHWPGDVTRRRARLMQADVDLRRASARLLADRAERLERLAARLNALDPARVLARGYAWLIDDASARAVTSVRQLNVGTRLQAVLADGVAGAVITELPTMPSAPNFP